MKTRFFLWTCLFAGLLISCDKEQKQVNWLEGDWELVDYFEYSEDGTRKLFFEKMGSASFQTSNKSKEGTMQMLITAIDHFGDTTRFEYDGKFLADSNHYFIYVDTMKIGLKIEAQTKKDLHFTALDLTQEPMSDMVLKKKN